MIGMVEHMEILKMQISCVRKLKDELHSTGHFNLHEEHFERILDEKVGSDCLSNMEKKWGRLKESLLLMERQFNSILEYNKMLEDSVSSFNNFFGQLLDPFNELVSIKSEKEELGALSSILVRKMERIEGYLQDLRPGQNSGKIVLDFEIFLEIHEIIKSQIEKVDTFSLAYKRFDSFNMTNLYEKYLEIKSNINTVQKSHEAIELKYYEGLKEIENICGGSVDSYLYASKDK